MNEDRIIVDYSVTEKWNKGKRRSLSQITELVIHHTAGSGDVYTLRDWMITQAGESTERIKKIRRNYKRAIGLFQFAIDRVGRIMKYSPIARWFYHSSSGKHDKYTVGVELCHFSGEFTEKQYQQLFWLAFEYLPYHCPNYSRIVAHDYNNFYYSGRFKGCPGNEFNWSRLEEEMDRRGIKYEKSGYKDYYANRYDIQLSRG